MTIIDGTGVAAGRLASYIAKQALQGEEITVLNSEKVVITGNKKNIKKEYEEKRSRVGSSQKGPKYPKTSERIVKRIIRGMLPDHRQGRGRDAWKRIKCYNGIPKEFEGKEMQKLDNAKSSKSVEVKFISK